MNNKWKIINIILVLIIILLLFVKCTKTKILKKNADIYNIKFNSKKDNCKLDNGNIIIEDYNGDYQYQTEINLFNNTKTIAPGVSNTYYFKVKNNNNITIKYLIELTKLSNYSVNIKYRLKRNDEYILGNDKLWVTSEELKTTYLNLSKGNIDNYSLDWKWFDNDKLDNYIGKSNINKYIVKLSFSIEENDNLWKNISISY